MAYPFGRPIRFSDFIARLCSEHECEMLFSQQEHFPIDMTHGARLGEGQRFRYIWRRTHGRVAVLPAFDPTHDDALRTIIRSTCARLEIDPAAFGILSEPGIDDTDDD